MVLYWFFQLIAKNGNLNFNYSVITIHLTFSLIQYSEKGFIMRTTKSSFVPNVPMFSKKRILPAQQIRSEREQLKVPFLTYSTVIPGFPNDSERIIINRSAPGHTIQPHTGKSEGASQAPSKADIVRGDAPKPQWET
jgi:hypothetical protein